MIRFSKRASDDTLWVEVMWILLTLIVFSVFFVFVNKSVNGQSIYEEVYAKKISLIIDGARPGSAFSLDVTKPVGVAIKGGKDCGIGRENSCFSINNDGKVVVSLKENDVGYSREFFSNYNVKFSLNSVGGKSILVIEVDK